MTELYLFNKEEVLINIIPEDDFNNDSHVRELNSKWSFEFTTTFQYLNDLSKSNKVGFYDRYREFRLFKIIKEPEVDYLSDEVVVNCLNDCYEMSDQIIEDKRLRDGTARQALDKVLEGSSYEVGEVAELGNRTINFYDISRMEGLNNIIESYGGELDYRIEFDADFKRISHKYVDIKSRLGQDTGLRFTYDLNLESVVRKDVSESHCTVLYGRGGAIESGDGYSRKIKFTDVEWKKPTNPIDKPIGQTYIEDLDAIAKYGRIEGIYENSDIEEPGELLQATYEALQECKNPKLSYEVNAKDLASQNSDYDHLTVVLGDSVILLDEDYDLNLESRIVGFEESIKEESAEMKWIIGNVQSSFSSDNASSGQIIKPSTGDVDIEIDDDKFPDALPDVPIIEAEGLFGSVIISWTYESKSYYEYELYASKLESFNPDASNLIFRGKASSYHHQVKPSETWYYRARAINTHGRTTDFSSQVKASTLKIEDGTEYFEKAAIADALIGELRLDRGWVGQLRGNWIDAKQLSVTDGNGKRTLDIDSFGNVNLDVTSLKIKNNSVATESFVSNAKNDAINSANNNTTIALENHYTKSETDSKISVAKDEINLGVSNTYETKTNVETKVASTLNSAKSYSDTKKTEAINAAATDATNKVNSAKTELNTAIGKKANSVDVYTKSEVYTKAQTDSAIKVAKDEINLGISSTYETKTNVETKINGVTIGGTNLLLNSHFDYDRNWAKGTGVTRVREGFDGGYCMKTVGALKGTRNFSQGISITKLEKGQQYTATVWLKTQDVVRGTTNPHLYFFASYSLNNKWVTEHALSKAIPNGTTAWTKYVLTFTMPTEDFDIMSVEGYARDFTGTIWWDGIKLEKGNKASDWSPSPLDISTDITNAKTDAINTASTDATNKVNSAKTELNAAIGKKANSADVYTKTQVYTKDETNSQINIAKEAINLGVSNTYETKANVTTKVSNAVVEARRITDSRNTNQNPQWYMTNYPKQTISEFKSANVIGIPNASTNYGTLTTNTPWKDASGSYPVQTFKSSDYKTYERRGTSLTNWGGWVQIENAIDSQTKANTAKQEAITSANNTLTTTIANYYTKAQTDSAIKVAKDSIDLSVKSLEEEVTNIEVTMNNIQIGSRNLVQNSAFNSTTGWSVGGGWGINKTEKFRDNNSIYISRSGLTADAWSELRSNAINVKHGEKIVGSWYIKYSSCDMASIVCLWGYKADGSGRVDLTSALSLSGTNANWTRYVLKGTVPANVDYVRLAISHRRNGIIYAAMPQLEYGNTVSDWSPSPVDVNNDITQAKNDAITSSNNTLVTTIANYYTKTQTDSQIKVAKDAIDLSVKSVDEKVSNVTTTINNIQVGGRNLMLKTDIDKFGLGLWVNNGGTGVIEGTYVDGTKTIKVTGNSGIYHDKFIRLKRNTVYTYSMMIKPSAAITVGNSNPLHMWLNTTESAAHLETVIASSGAAPANVWTKAWITFRTPNTQDTYYMRPYLYGIGTATVYITQPQVEEGNKASSWISALEDIQTNIDTAKNDAITSANNTLNTTIKNYYTKTETDSAIKVAKDSITSSVSNTYATKTELSSANTNISNLTNRVQTAESKLTKDSLTTTIGNHYTTSSDVNGIVTSKGYQTSSQVQQTVDALQLKFTQSGGYNLLRNGKASLDTKYWVSNGGGISRATDVVYGTCFKTSLPSGIKYNGGSSGSSSAIRLKNNTHYVYEATIYSRTSLPGTATSPLHFWCSTSPSTSGTGQCTVVDYRQSVSKINTWTKCYVHILTASSGEVWFTPFIYTGGSYTGDLWVTEISLSEGAVETPYSPHSSEIYDGVTTIDKDGVTVKSSNGAYTNFNSVGMNSFNNSGQQTLGIRNGGITFHPYSSNQLGAYITQSALHGDSAAANGLAISTANNGTYIALGISPLSDANTTLNMDQALTISASDSFQPKGINFWKDVHAHGYGIRQLSHLRLAGSGAIQFDYLNTSPSTIYEATSNGHSLYVMGGYQMHLGCMDGKGVPKGVIWMQNSTNTHSYTHWDFHNYTMYNMKTASTYANYDTRRISESYGVTSNVDGVRYLYKNVELVNGKAIRSIPLEYKGCEYDIVSIVCKGRGSAWVETEDENRFEINGECKSVNIEIIIYPSEAVMTASTQQLEEAPTLELPKKTEPEEALLITNEVV